MKITAVEPLIVGGKFVLVWVHTDEGLVGIGECSPMNAPVIASTVDHTLAGLLTGEDPMAIERLVEKLAIATYKLEGRTQAIAISGVELALWDLKGKALGVPVYELLGGLHRDRVRVYATVNRDTPAAMGRRAGECVAAGFTALKLQISSIWGFDPRPDTSVEVVREVRSAVGEGVEIMLDANSAWTVPTAIAMCRRLAEFNIRFLEQPVPERDLDALAAVKRASPIPITFGEEEYSFWRFKEALVRDAADFVQPDPIKAGGLLVCKKVAVLAEAFSRDCVPHSSQINVGFAANLHLIASTPNCRGAHECWITPGRKPDLVRDELLMEPFRVEDGHVAVPRRPGLGVALNEEIVRQYSRVTTPTLWPGAGAPVTGSGVPQGE